MQFQSVLQTFLMLWALVLVQCHDSERDIALLRSRRLRAQAEIQYWNKQFNSSNRADGDAMDSATLYGMSQPMSALDVTMAESGYIMMEVIDEMKLMESNTTISKMEVCPQCKRGFKQIVGDICPPETMCSPMVKFSPYRTYDGSCNNLNYPRWGMAERAQARQLPPAYDDGFGSPRSLGVDRSPLPNTRNISNNIHKPDLENQRDYNATVMVMSFGQFLDHDIIKTPVTKALDNSAINCCGEKMGKGSGPLDACLPIYIQNDDPHFKRTNQTCMHFIRALPAPCEGCVPCQRQQINSHTSYIDSNNVYGSSESISKQLRTFTNGTLIMENDGALFPERTGSNLCTLTHASHYCFKTGDTRVNNNPNLSSSHMLFARSHNAMAETLSKLNPKWSDEMTFQETRKINNAIMQHIAYNEYLPVVLGDAIMTRYSLTVSGDVYNDVYDDTVDATITNSFGAAAFRFGHATIPNKQRASHSNFTLAMSVPIEHTFHNPELMFQNGDGISRWLVSHMAIRSNRFFEKGVRDLLFLADGKSLDLPAVNIQRGRDQGIPPYNAFRELCHLNNVTDAEFQARGTRMGDFNIKTADAFRDVYSHADDIDLFAGGVSETLLEGAQVGPLFACMLGLEFRRLKIGDRFYYENPAIDGRPGFTLDQLKSIKQMSFAKLICEHMNAPNIQKNVFRPACYKNPLVSCDELPVIDLSKWTVQN